MVPPAFGSGILCILNISKQGVGFTIGSSVKRSNPIVPGQKIMITFQLDDRKRTTIEKTITVRVVDDHYVGGEFEITQAYDKNLGFYLLSG
jgi:3-hydroxymyristoyl/3-hydroxydecanoyl-(acyl carrier protein) dehydratase